METDPTVLFRQYREEAGLSQNRLSIEAGYDHSYVSRIEGGTRTPTREALKAFITSMGLLGEDKDYLLMDAFGYVTERHILASPLIIAIHNRVRTDENFERSLRSVLGIQQWKS